MSLEEDERNRANFEKFGTVDLKGKLVDLANMMWRVAETENPESNFSIKVKRC